MRIGIDLGGTKIEGIALDGGAELARIRVDTPRDDYGATLDAIASLVGNLERRAGARGTVGVGIPGALSPSTGVVKNANSVWLIGQPLRGDLESRLDREVRIANDANCFAVSEAADGAARGAVVVFGVIVGTGVGGGIVVEGRVLTGRNVIAGEWGHNPLPWPSDEEWPGPLCYCGRTGCIETFLSGAGLAREHERRTGNRETPERIAAAADESNDTLATYEHRMSRALAGVINILDPDVIVLGGGLSNIERLYRNVPRLWEEFVLGVARLGAGRRREPVATRLVRAAHGDSSGVRGAAWLW